jgi:hypothetical protein
LGWLDAIRHPFPLADGRLAVIGTIGKPATILPEFGQNRCRISTTLDSFPMSQPTELEDLVAYLVRTSRLTRSEAVRIVGDVLSFLDERPEEFVIRRHRALQGEGLPNGEIFSRLAAELTRWRFRAPAYSERQLRRLIYG